MVAQEMPRLAHGLGDMPGMIDSGAEQEPGPPVAAVRDHLVDRRPGDRVLVDRGLELRGDELAAASADAGDVELGRGLLADQRAR